MQKQFSNDTKVKLSIGCDRNKWKGVIIMVSLQIEIFLLLIVGYVLGKIRMISVQTRNQLTDIVVCVILPCSILCSFQMNLSPEILKATIYVLITAFCIQLFYMGLNLFLYRKFPKEEQAACKYSTMVTNASFIGIPVIGAVYGTTGVLYASIFVIPQRIFMWLYGLPLYAKVDKKEVVRKILTHPCVVSIFAGIGIMYLYTNGIYLPDSISSTLSALGNCTTAICLIVIGSVLSDLKLKEMFSVHAAIFSIYRLFLIPLVLIFILRLTPLDTLARQVCVLLSAMPAPTTTVILSQKYGRNPEFASKVLVTSTLMSLISIPMIEYLVKII